MEIYIIFVFFISFMNYIFVIIYRLNLCRQTAAETRELCEKVADVLTGYLTKHLNAPSEFYHIASAILDGLWYMDITLDKHAFLKFMCQLHGIERKYSTIIFILTAFF